MSHYIQDAALKGRRYKIPPACLGLTPKPDPRASVGRRLSRTRRTAFLRTLHHRRGLGPSALARAQTANADSAECAPDHREIPAPRRLGLHLGAARHPAIRALDKTSP